MRVHIRILQQESGQRVAQTRRFDGDVLHIGRATTQDIELADIRVALVHAELRLLGKGRYAIAARGGSSIWLNGAPTTAGRAEIGDVIRIGRYHLNLREPEDDADLLLEVEEQVSARDERAQFKQKYRTRLEQTGLSKRRLAWLLLLLVLLPALIVPVVLRYGVHAPQPHDQIWNPGPISAVHARFGNDCSTCHGKAFEPVRDQACTSCHTDVHQHSDHPKILTLPAMAQMHCTDCHQEHQGSDKLITRNTALCTSCHAKPEPRFALAHLSPAADFGSDHPLFTARLSRFRDGKFVYDEVREDNKAAWHQDTRLIYPHDKHLTLKGVDSPKGKVVMQCGDCHVPDASGREFLPISYEKHCADCHRLDFDPDVPQRLLPHRNPKEAVSIIRDFYAGVALAGGVNKADAPSVVQLRRIPGVELNPSDRRVALAWANQRATQTIDDVFDRRVCSYCHEVSKTDDPDLPWQVTPVNLQSHVYTGARFNHADHRMEKCESCHDGVRHSKKSADVLLPGIATCRQCHTGTHAKTASSGSAGTECLECHRFHTAEHTLLDGRSVPMNTAPARPSAPMARQSTGAPP